MLLAAKPNPADKVNLPQRVCCLNLFATELSLSIIKLWGFPSGSDGKRICLQCRRPRFDPSREDPLKKGKATHSSVLAWRISWTEEPGRLQSMGSHRVGHN